jgi:uncharacterized protein YjdB
MRNKLLLAALLCVGLMVPLTGCTNPTGLDSISLSPSSQSLAIGQTVQLTATGSYGNANHIKTQTVTTGVTWSSSSDAVATVSASGLVTAMGVGSASITASAQGFNGPVSSTATVTVGGTGTGGTLATIAVVPGAQSVSTLGQTTQFTAIGTTSTGATEYLTNVVTWSSSDAGVATIGAATGLATAVGPGTATITALFNSQSSTISGIATLTVSASASGEVTALTVTPTAESISASAQTAQLIALGTIGTTQLPQNYTDKVTWASSIPSVATVTSSGLVQGVSAGTTTITALYTNQDNSVASASATITVTSTAAPEPLLSLAIIPSGGITVGNLQDTGNFLAIGTFSTAPYVRDLTNSVTWLSSAPEVFPVITGNNGVANPGAPAGTVTAYGAGTATIIAEATDPATGSIQTATSTFTCPIPSSPPQPGQCYQGSQTPSLLATVTVYNEGLNTTNWEVTGPSATNTPDVIHCGPGWALNGGTGGSVCVATYPVGTTVTLTAPNTGANFGGWSSSCTTINPNPSTAAGPNTCSFTISGTNPNISIGAIFN